MLEAVDELPINVGLFGKGCVSQPEAIREQITAGAIGLKIHEDWATPMASTIALMSPMKWMYRWLFTLTP